MACGGGDPYEAGSVTPAGGPTAAPSGGFTSVISFGDSLSDVGSYTPATSTSTTTPGAPPYSGGKFTTNIVNRASPSPSANAPIWIETVASRVNRQVTQAEIGFGAASTGNPAACPFGNVGTSTCTAYGEGGARISNAIGIGHFLTGTTTPAAMTRSVTDQVAAHLAKTTGSANGFQPNDLIFVWAGANDVLVQFQGFATSAGQAAAIFQASAKDQAAQDVLSNSQLTAQLVAQANLKVEALKLADLVKTQILAKGGKYVAVVNVPDIGATPQGAVIRATPGAGPAAQKALTDMASVFNLWLREGLKDQPVQWIDAAAIFAEIRANPATFGFVNVTAPACDVANLPNNSSLFCSGSTLVTGADATTWLFADAIHPTTGGHAAISNAFITKLQGFGWIN
ncbi:MAG: SGNH/GDSL hydrolase family protein [Leptothrix sp. (in: b-proteobacteria)]